MPECAYGLRSYAFATREFSFRLGDGSSVLGRQSVRRL
jgi:hypothetical protein